MEGLLGPAQQGIPLAVAHVLPLDVARVGAQRSERIDLHGMVDDQVGLHQWIDASRILARALHRGAHRGQVNDRRDAGEVLQQHPGWFIRDLGFFRR